MIKINKMDEVYAERNKLVAALSKLFPAWIGTDGTPGWFVVYIELPTGQASWHFKESERNLVSHLKEGGAMCIWDGHTTEEKYERLAKL
jgi:hypothetical protein